MSTATWVRGTFQGTGLQVASAKMAVVPRGSILRRIHYGWRCSGTMSTRYSAPNLLDTEIAVGIITGYPDTSYVVPNAFTTPNDPAPPTNRYLWWEMRQLVPRTWGSNVDDIVTFTDSGPVEPTDSRGQVTASTPPGENLGVYMSWAPTRSDFPSAGYIQTSGWWSVLYTT